MQPKKSRFYHPSFPKPRSVPLAPVDDPLPTHVTQHMALERPKYLCNFKTPVITMQVLCQLFKKWSGLLLLSLLLTVGLFITAFLLFLPGSYLQTTPQVDFLQKTDKSQNFGNWGPLSLFFPANPLSPAFSNSLEFYFCTLDANSQLIQKFQGAEDKDVSLHSKELLTSQSRQVIHQQQRDVQYSLYFAATSRRPRGFWTPDPKQLI